MHWRSILIRLRGIFARPRAEAELDDELATHLALQINKYMAAGMSADEAARRARIDFGTLDPVREQCRDIDRWSWLDSAHRCFGYAVRLLRRSPGFTLVAVAILAVAFGANLAVFNLMNALLFRALPVEDPGRLVHIAARNADGRMGSAFSTMLDPLRRVPDFQGVCGFNTSYEAIEVAQSVNSVGILGVSGDCFQTLGIRTQLGRPITMADDRSGTEPVAVITDALWRNVLGGRPDALGRRIRIENQLYTIVGVAEQRFNGLLVGFPAGVLMPLHQESGNLPGGRKATYYWVNLLARLAPGVSQNEAAMRLRDRQHQLLEQSVPPNFTANRARAYLAGVLALEPGKSGVDYFLRARFGQYLWAMAGVCACLLLIGCVNLSSLLLARGLRRRREVAVRFALGASRMHVASIFALEAILLVAAGAGVGVLLAQAMDQVVVNECAARFGNFDLRLALDTRSLLFLLLAATCTADVFAAASIWQTDRLRVAGHLRGEGRGIAGAHSRSQHVVIGVQMALTLALVAGSGLLSSSLERLDSIPLGFETSKVQDVMLAARPDAPGIPSPAYYRDLLQRVAALPGVTSAAFADFVPLGSWAPPEPVAALEGPQAGHELQSSVVAASGDVFRTMGIRILAGEPFQTAGEETAEPTVILSQSLAERLGNPRELIGGHIRIGSDSRYRRLTIAGIAGNTELSLVNPDEHNPYIAWLDIWQHLDRQGYPIVLLRSAGAPLSTDALRRSIDSHGPLVVERVHTLDNERDGALMENRLLAWLSGAFALMALAMAATGLFGTLSYQVTQRTSEIGIRMALGAERRQIRSMISRQILALVGAGCAAGLAVSLLAGKAIAGLLYGVSPYDPALLAGACAVLTITAMIAAWLPTRRASSVDPLTALRHE
jgi:predicted permease